MLVQIFAVVASVVIAVCSQPLDPVEQETRGFIQVFNFKRRAGDLAHSIWNSWNSILLCGALNCTNLTAYGELGNPARNTSRLDGTPSITNSSVVI
ncbi:hypothetical protein GE061_012654 [Apolygus lucorum]|uniref:Uncharacterized protein n=1 Tax=Apolygus lucorum TaxID=248454 RepID=A0A8S9XT64_APOLU|nr:hypothetical protein GE061_012654 [Apolygus lucorum]